LYFTDFRSSSDLLPENLTLLLTKIDEKSAPSLVKKAENASQNPETGCFSRESDERFIHEHSNPFLSNAVLCDLPKSVRFSAAFGDTPNGNGQLTENPPLGPSTAGRGRDGAHQLAFL
jgi:hypothetical protein